MTSFIHLHLHTEYSLVDGIVQLKPLMKVLAAEGMPAVAVTDRSNLFIAVKFYQAALQAGIKAIFGSEIYYQDPHQPDKHFPLLLLCKNQIGYKNLTCLISKAYLEGQKNGVPIVQKAWLKEYAAGLLVLSAGLQGDIGQALLNEKFTEAKILLEEWCALFPESFYLELQRTGRSLEETYIHAAVDLAAQCQVPVVATNDVRFIKSDDFYAHEARVCIHDGYVLEDNRRPHLYSQQQYLRSSTEMQELFADIPEAITNTVEIAKRCNAHLQLNQHFLPDFPIPENLTVAQYLEKNAQEGLTKRLATILDKSDAQYAARLQLYQARLMMELDVINSMGFPGYFLIVADFIGWSRDNAIPVGPGRGSGAGSLVAYALQITGLDPIEHELLFERFLNPERVSMPDFDIDFCMEGRDRVIEYVAQKYGRENVAQIITYGSMTAKAVVRDVGRVLGHPYGFVDKIAKLIPFELGITLDKALAQEEDLSTRYQQEDDVKALIDLAKKLEGLVRNAGKHAGGVVIAPSKLTDFTPLYCEAGGESLVTQFDKDDVEAVGLVKFDFLGLRTLTIINWAVQTINQQRNTPLDINTLPMDDKVTFDLLKSCQTTAVFQLESRGMKDLMKRLQPDSFEEIVALVALFRPGPLQSGMVDDFIDRKHGRAQVEYPHADLETILRPTYGVILYQEQVMQIAQTLAGYTLGGADLLRRAMGKKKVSEMKKQRAVFSEGAAKHGVDVETATRIFDLIEKFAGYGFNRSHSAAYALVAYQTAWLKAHYPAAFMAAVLSSDMDNTDKIVNFIQDTKAIALTVLAPHVNTSRHKFIAQDDKTIRYGLGAIKGVGQGAVAAIIDAREVGGDFCDFFDFCERIDARKVNRRVLEALIRAGALDNLGAHRASLFLSVDIALRHAEQYVKNKQVGQNDLFGSTEGERDNSALTYVQITPWNKKQYLAGEKDTLGYYFSGHPLEQYEKELVQLTTCKIVDVQTHCDQSVVVAGLVVAVRKMLTKRGDRMAFITLDDGHDQVELAIFSDCFETCKDVLVKDQLLVVDGVVSVDDYNGGFKMLARRVFTLATARQHFGKRIKLTMSAQQTSSKTLEQLMAILQLHREEASPVSIDYKQGELSGELVFGRQWRVNPSDELFDSLESLLGEDAVTMVYA